MAALKVLVVVMGVLIVVGTLALVVAVVERGGHRPPAVAAATPGDIRVDLPAGARIVSTELAGDRILLRLALPKGEELMLFDARTGARVASIELHPSPAAATP